MLLLFFNVVFFSSRKRVHDVLVTAILMLDLSLGLNKNLLEIFLRFFFGELYWTSQHIIIRELWQPAENRNNKQGQLVQKL
jgi:hypothetical protein